MCNYSFTPFLDYNSTKPRVEFIKNCLRQDKVTLNHGKTVNIYIVYELSIFSFNSFYAGKLFI